MKRTRAALSCLVVLATLVATPQASAATCTYVKQDLPVPPEGYSVYLNGGSPDNSRLTGQTSVSVGGQPYTRGVHWVNGALRVMPSPPVGVENTYPIDVNNTSVVVGYEQDLIDQQPDKLRAFRFENGAYEYLETDQGQDSMAEVVNEAGDVAGRQGSDVYLWPRNGARKRIAASSGIVIGLTDGGKIVTRGTSAVLVHDANGGPTVRIPGNAATTATFDNDRVFLAERTASGEREIAEYDLNGVKIASHPGGHRAFGRNNSGTFWGTYVAPGTFTQSHSLWGPTGRSGLVASPMPLISTYSDITDTATLIGTYHDAAQTVRPARWVCG